MHIFTAAVSLGLLTTVIHGLEVQQVTRTITEFRAITQAPRPTSVANVEEVFVTETLYKTTIPAEVSNGQGVKVTDNIILDNGKNSEASAEEEFGYDTSYFASHLDEFVSKEPYELNKDSIIFDSVEDVLDAEDFRAASPYHLEPGYRGDTNEQELRKGRVSNTPDSIEDGSSERNEGKEKGFEESLGDAKEELQTKIPDGQEILAKEGEKEEGVDLPEAEEIEQLPEDPDYVFDHDPTDNDTADPQQDAGFERFYEGEEDSLEDQDKGVAFDTPKNNKNGDSITQDLEIGEEKEDQKQQQMNSESDSSFRKPLKGKQIVDPTDKALHVSGRNKTISVESNSSYVSSSLAGGNTQGGHSFSSGFGARLRAHANVGSHFRGEPFLTFSFISMLTLLFSI